jgi:beta-1,3-galactosyltransferase 1
MQLLMQSSLNRTKARAAVDSEVSAAPVSGLLHEKLLGSTNTSRKPQGSLAMTSSVPGYPTNGRRRTWPNPDGEATISPFPMDIDFVLHDPDLCRRSQAAKQPTEWLIYFHSKADNIERRDLLRVTWASEHFFRQPIVKRVFMIGQPHDGATFTKLLAEFDQHRDLVVGNFVDSYRNLTLKSIMALKWISTYCANARYAVKADDDVFVNMAEVTSLIRNLPERKRTLVCAVNDAGLMPILRDPQSCLKWCVADTDFPGDYGYPTYCSGLAYVISMDIVRDLYEAALRTRATFTLTTSTQPVCCRSSCHTRSTMCVFVTAGIMLKLWAIMPLILQHSIMLLSLAAHRLSCSTSNEVSINCLLNNCNLSVFLILEHN